MSVTYSALTVVGGTVITSVWGNTVRNGVPCYWASAATRDAALTSPEAGWHAFLGDVALDTVYDGAAWKYVDHAGVSTPDFGSVNTAGTTTSTSYTDALTGTSNVSVSMVAPQSGRVEVALCGKAQNSTSAHSYISYRLEGDVSGTIASEDDVRSFRTKEIEIRGGITNMHSGASPGETLTVTAYHRVSGGTGTFDDRYLSIKPLP